MARTLRRALAGTRGALLLGSLILATATSAAAPPRPHVAAAAVRAAAAPSAARASPTPSPASRGAPSHGRGLAWQLRGAAGGTVYLVGSMHLMRPGDAALPAAFERAYAEAEALVMELDVDDVDPTAATAFTAANATFGPGDSLRGALGEQRWLRAQQEFERLGLQLEAFDRLEPWAVALVYSVSSMARLGFEPGLGVEEQLKVRAAADGKPIEGLETLEYQLGLFDALTPADQARFLDLTLEDAAIAARDVDALARAWRGGDARALARLLLREYRRFPTLYEPLVHVRNRNWIPRIEALLQRADDTLVVVGALHLVGDQGLVALLRERGLQFERMPLH